MEIQPILTLCDFASEMQQRKLPRNRIWSRLHSLLTDYLTSVVNAAQSVGLILKMTDK